MYILLMAVLSAAFCYGLSYPLWRFATERPNLYTKIILFLAIATLIIFTLVRIIKRYKACSPGEQKKRWLKRFIIIQAIIIEAHAAFFISIKSVLTGNRLIALIIFVSGMLLTYFLLKLKARFSDV